MTEPGLRTSFPTSPLSTGPRLTETKARTARTEPGPGIGAVSSFRCADVLCDRERFDSAPAPQNRVIVALPKGGTHDASSPGNRAAPAEDAKGVAPRESAPPHRTERARVPLRRPAARASAGCRSSRGGTVRTCAGCTGAPVPGGATAARQIPGRAATGSRGLGAHATAARCAQAVRRAAQDIGD